MSHGPANDTTLTSPSRVRIEPYRPSMLTATATMLARAFATNPLHVAAFGTDAIASNEAFFRVGLAVMKGQRYVASAGGRPIGFVHWVAWPACRFTPSEKLRMLPEMMTGLGLRASWRLTRWLAAWSSLDPSEPHLHLGPIGVHPRAQGRHVGRQLMHVYCDELDRHAISGYLETDRLENVAFYRRFGFEVTSERLVLGVPNVFMTRRTAA